MPVIGIGIDERNLKNIPNRYQMKKMGKKATFINAKLMPIKQAPITSPLKPRMRRPPIAPTMAKPTTICHEGIKEGII